MTFSNCLASTALAGMAALTLNSGVLAQNNPADFSDQLRDRYTVGTVIERHTLAERMAAHNVPGMAIAILEDGEVVYAAGFGTARAGSDLPITADSVFSAGSVSKIATAAMVLALQAEGRIDIDQPVSTYLTRWALADQPEYDEDQVTLRTILSHTAGFNLHGFPDFQPGQPMPSRIETLNGTGPARQGALTLLAAPGSGYRYSGGGYTLAEQVIADRLETGFEEAAQSVLFEPLGMHRTTFANPLPEGHGDIAYAHGRDGAPAALPRGYEAMAELAASGMWTSANDLGALVVALIESYRSPDGFLPQDLATDMMTKVSPSEHGLGPRLSGAGAGLFFHHGGANNSYQTWIEGHLATGDGLVVLTNGSRGSALYTEIRNAVADTMDWEINTPVYLPALNLPAAQLQSYTGTYAVDADFPRDQREQVINGFFDQGLIVSMQEGELVLAREGSDQTIELIATAPNRFLITAFNLRDGIAEVEFHRDAFGQSGAMTLHMPNARSRYERQ
ncbi:serine hydrolase domain-containing protein [Maricaulis sp.]|uniref:serine hydrolase domain-containing protein n=1 Tax=Maricaulis sp. TaxID=1486257 RepID=UPI00261F2DCF|nr:serine hydrolase domain-containing protein [Maricaulis sp.]